MGSIEMKIESNVDVMLFNAGMEGDSAAKAIVKKAMLHAFKKVRDSVKIATPNDKNEAWKGVHMAIYKSILGGNFNILTKKKRSGMHGSGKVVRASRSGMLGGNRRKRSARTEQVDSYQGSDRDFILRFLNDGTQNRFIKLRRTYPDVKSPGSHGGHSSYQNRNTGKRGSLSGSGFFSPAAEAGVEEAADEIIRMIDEEIKKYEV